MDLPPSMALPPPIAITASWEPELYAFLPIIISSSRGFGEISEKMALVRPSYDKKVWASSTKGKFLLPRSVTMRGFDMPSLTQCLPNSENRPGP